MQVLVLALGVAFEIFREAHAPGGHNADRTNGRAALDVCLAILSLAEGAPEAEASTPWCVLREAVTEWDNRYTDAPRARWWTPQMCQSRVDSLMSVAEIMERTGQSLASWRTASMADLEEVWPSPAGNDETVFEER